MASKFGVMYKSNYAALLLVPVALLIGIAALLIGIFTIDLATGFIIFGVYSGIMLIAVAIAAFGTAMFDTVTIGEDALIYKRLGKVKLELPLKGLEAARCYVKNISGYGRKTPNALIIGQKGSVPAERRFASRFNNFTDGWFCCRAGEKLIAVLSLFTQIEREDI